MVNPAFEVWDLHVTCVNDDGEAALQFSLTCGKRFIRLKVRDRAEALLIEAACREFLHAATPGNPLPVEKVEVIPPKECPF